MRAGVALLVLTCVLPIARAELRIAAMHPVVGDLVRQIGGEQVKVVDLIPLHLNIHNFDPTPDVLKEASQAQVVLAAGKHLEDGWIDKIRDNLPPGTEVVEVGRRIPSLLIDTKDELFVCCPDHAAGSLDPHWWHSVKNIQRAVRIIADVLAEKDPANKDVYKAGAKAYDEELSALHSWAKKQIATIPRADRELSTAHLAFAYLCKEYGFRAIPVLGLKQEQDPSPKQLSDAIAYLKKYEVKAIFPEKRANPKALETLSQQAGIKVAGILLADGVTEDYPTFIEMMRYNIQTIVDGLTTDSETE
jgi:zinc/manganese transport system substrate-binding protein